MNAFSINIFLLFLIFGTPSRRGFKIAHLNINSLNKHIDELRILLFYYSIDIISQLMKLT